MSTPRTVCLGLYLGLAHHVLFFNIFINDFGKNIKVMVVKFVNDRRSRRDNDVFSDKIGIQKDLAGKKAWPNITRNLIGTNVKCPHVHKEQSWMQGMGQPNSHTCEMDFN